MLSRDDVIKLYVAMFQRAPSKAEVDNWYDYVQKNNIDNLVVLGNVMVVTAMDAVKTYGLEDLYPNYINVNTSDLQSIRGVLEAVYKTLFGKDYTQDPEGIDSWVYSVINGDMSIGDAIAGIVWIGDSIAQNPDVWKDAFETPEKFQEAYNAAMTFEREFEAAKKATEIIPEIKADKEIISDMKNLLEDVKTNKIDITQIESALQEIYEKINKQTQNTQTYKDTPYIIENGTIKFTSPPMFKNGSLENIDWNTIHSIEGTNSDDWIIVEFLTVDDYFNLMPKDEHTITVKLKEGNDIFESPGRGFIIDGGEGEDEVIFINSAHKIEDDALVNVEKVSLTTSFFNQNETTLSLDLSNQSENGFIIKDNPATSDNIKASNGNDIVYLYGGINIEDYTLNLRSVGSDSLETLGGDDSVYVYGGEGTVIELGEGKDSLYIQSSNIKNFHIVENFSQPCKIGEDKIYLNISKKGFDIGRNFTITQANNNEYYISDTDKTAAIVAHISPDTSKDKSYLYLYYLEDKNQEFDYYKETPILDVFINESTDQINEDTLKEILIPYVE